MRNLFVRLPYKHKPYNPISQSRSNKSTGHRKATGQMFGKLMWKIQRARVQGKATLPGFVRPPFTLKLEYS